MDNHRASWCACQPLAANYFVVKTGNPLSRFGDSSGTRFAACMHGAQAPRDGGTRLVLGGPSLRGGYREILFDAEGRLLAAGPVLKKVHM
jgi:hypothetical protein